MKNIKLAGDLLSIVLLKSLVIELVFYGRLLSKLTITCLV